MKKIIIAAVVLVVFIAVAASVLLFFTFRTSNVAIPPATNYEECVAAGGTIQESYPSVCRSPEGKSFTQDIGNETEKRDLIRVETPRPGQTVSSPLTVRGEARGNWFFEASFPIKLVDMKGETIVQTHAQAGGEWMTTEFVPFIATLEFETNATQGKLILEKDNPSGLPHNDDYLEIPVRL